MQLYAGIDLHSNNNYIGIIDEQDQKVFGKRLPNRLKEVHDELYLYKDQIVGVVVESTYNWYWLVDGLEADGYKVHLANPSAIKQYEGRKYTDDRWDSFWLAQLLRLNILPEGYIYPREERPLRDLMRRRVFFVKHRTSHILSFQCMLQRHCGDRMSCAEIKTLKEEDAASLFDSPTLVLSAKNNIAAIRFLSERVKLIEKEVKAHVKLRKEYQGLLTIPGIGEILASTIMLEVGDIRRFPRVGNYSSYCRCVKSERWSNNKKKGEGNRKNGNRYLAWAYMEAANFAIQYSTDAQRFYQRKMAKSNQVVARKALSNKLARASYYIMRDQVPYDPDKLFN